MCVLALIWHDKVSENLRCLNCVLVSHVRSGALRSLLVRVQPTQALQRCFESQLLSAFEWWYPFFGTGDRFFKRCVYHLVTNTKRTEKRELPLLEEACKIAESWEDDIIFKRRLQKHY